MSDTYQEVLEACSAVTIASDDVFWGAEICGVQPFVPYLDVDGRIGATSGLHLLRRRGDSRYESIWQFEGTEAADEVDRLFAWMWSQANRWSSWGRAASGLGGGFLSSLVARESVDAGRPLDATVPIVAPEGGSNGDEPGDDGEDDDGDDEDPDALWCYCGEVGYGRRATHSIALRRGRLGTLPFFILRYDKASERDRVWDWMQHQTGRYGEFEGYLNANGSDKLKKLIYGGMLEAERAVKKAGMGSGGLRPLRFWPGPESSDA